jgi:hypothetical protein
MRLLILFLTSAVALLAQSNGYGFLGPGIVTGGGDSSGLFRGGIGAEYMLRDRIGVGGELGFLSRSGGTKAGVSANLVYQLEPRGRATPFITGGYSRLFGLTNGANFANLGGGANLWRGDHWGFRLEVRDHFRSDGNVLEFRVGIVFR